jgi:hypothetical protein
MHQSRVAQDQEDGAGCGLDDEDERRLWTLRLEAAALRAIEGRQVCGRGSETQGTGSCGSGSVTVDVAVGSSCITQGIKGRHQVRFGSRVGNFVSRNCCTILYITTAILYKTQLDMLPVMQFLLLMPHSCHIHAACMHAADARGACHPAPHGELQPAPCIR